MTFRMKIEGFKELEMAQARAFSRYQRGYVAGLQKGCDMILKASNKICPIDTGELRQSGYTQVTGTGFNARGYVGYTAPYAVYVHENVHHKFKAPGTGAKFLEKAIQRLGSRIPNMIRTSMQKGG